jgi:hypothetical protein
MKHRAISTAAEPEEDYDDSDVVDDVVDDVRQSQFRNFNSIFNSNASCAETVIAGTGTGTSSSSTRSNSGSSATSGGFSPR